MSAFEGFSELFLSEVPQFERLKHSQVELLMPVSLSEVSLSLACLFEKDPLSPAANHGLRFEAVHVLKDGDA